MASTTEAIGFLQRLGFADILLWLLTFAIVYGFLSQIKTTKKGKQVPMFGGETRAIIAIVAGLLVIMSAPASLVTFLSQMSSSLVLIAIGLLVLLVIFEAFGIKHKVPVTDAKGKATGEMQEFGFLSSHPYLTGGALIIIAILVFIGAGGPALLGWDFAYNIDITGVAFLIAIIAALAWMVKASN